MLKDAKPIYNSEYKTIIILGVRVTYIFPVKCNLIFSLSRFEITYIKSSVLLFFKHYAK